LRTSRLRFTRSGARSASGCETVAGICINLGGRPFASASAKRNVNDARSRELVVIPVHPQATLAATYPRQDGRFGREAKAAAGTLSKIGGGAAGFDYIKVAIGGSDLGAGAGNLSTVNRGSK
jgi:hypothetical protein